MPWCPDPACRAEMPDEVWTSVEYGRPEDDHDWDEEAPFPELYAWSADCPGCGRRLSVHQSVEHSVAAEPNPDPENWCCPLCAHPAELRAMNRGPLGAYLRCAPGGCEARISLSRKPMVDLLRRPSRD